MNQNNSNTSECLSSRTANAGGDVGRRDSCYQLVRTTTLGISMEIPAKAENRNSIDPAARLLGILSEELKTSFYNDIWIPVFTAALSTVAELCKQPSCPSVDRWLKGKWYIHTVEYYSAFKNKEIVNCATP